MDSGHTIAGNAQSRLLARYRDPEFAKRFQGLGWNATLDTMLTHRSVRAFRDEPLPDGLLESLVAAAQSASTSSNLQAWSVVAVSDRERKARLAKLAAEQRHVSDAPLLVVFLADLSRLRAASDARGQKAEGLDYVETFIVALADVAFAAQNFLTAAESMGLGGCYIGAIRNHPQEVADELGLPADVFAAFGMALGYPDTSSETGVKPRLAQTLVLHHERYQSADARALASYDRVLRDFRAEQKMSDVDWTELAASRVKDKTSLMGREELGKFLQSRGFGLR